MVCAYYKMLAHKMAGSGMADILLEAEMITSGSIIGVLIGKIYAQAMYCHKRLLEALNWLIFEAFIFVREEESVFEGLRKNTRKVFKGLAEWIDL